MESHPLLQYTVVYLFLHAALAEENGISQDSLRLYISDDIASSFKRSTNLYNLMSVGEIRFQPAEKNNMV